MRFARRSRADLQNSYNPQSHISEEETRLQRPFSLQNVTSTYVLGCFRDPVVALSDVSSINEPRASR